MGLWLLSFTEREVAIIVEAETLTHARLLAAANQVCRASQFDEGWAIGALQTWANPGRLYWANAFAR
jgi:hypothetical protein